MTHLLLALAPACLLMFYIYWRDKYEHEPIKLVLRGIVLGMLIIFPVGAIESVLRPLGHNLPDLTNAAFVGYVVAGATEESFKFLMVFLLFWNNRNFNEKFDGIVYAVSVALGFAAIENIYYVFSDRTLHTGLVRAVTAVPAHAIFGVVMGFYLGLARFDFRRRSHYLRKAFLIPWLMHGTYDFLLFSKQHLLLFIFVPFLIYMYVNGLRKMRKLNEQSVFNPANINLIHPEDDSKDVFFKEFDN
jgi:RsiW-degrading membrane proteinase PrsW (M82 family)